MGKNVVKIIKKNAQFLVFANYNFLGWLGVWFVAVKPDDGGRTSGGRVGRAFRFRTIQDSILVHPIVLGTDYCSRLCIRALRD